MSRRVVRKDEHYHQEQDWLSTYWHFSFDHYFDPDNVSFGPLRVFNDDEVQPGGGWGMHPHRDMEIVTYVVEGRIAHEDSSGGHGVLEAGDVQAMTAGRGIRHSEYNPSEEEPLRLVQIWILPDERGLPPAYDSRQLGGKARNALRPIVGPEGNGDVLPIHQDATLAIGRLDPEAEVATVVEADRRGYLCVLEGSVQAEDDVLGTRDVMRLVGPEPLALQAQEEAEVIFLDLPMR